ncbi:hypothetical protein PVL29_012343 [Vitis rotundifolia]|uniref:Late embryogenesis abundant protein LEA-2 subgroup domain-containing protein n=1 Tax=Vitis rotundifolia TaxID=103349 RepID=A0AA38ZIS2_VITRO|nr:hypothetical protein PVL29_012343 [Vitis rotundifolia]
MNSTGRQTAPPIKRHHTARYYAHRVRESLTTRLSKFICTIFLGLLLVLGVVTFILWLSLRPHRPRFHIHKFSVPNLAEGAGFTEITFNVTARNSNQNIGIYYDSMEASIYYKDQRVATTSLLFPFYQEPKNTTVIYKELNGNTITENSERTMELMNDVAKGTVVFGLELTSTIRFKVSTWKTKGHRMHANCDVGVGQDGNILGAYKDKRCPVYFT